jgi:7-keto-8-aminopelargonate synthetase-like enzyme
MSGETRAFVDRRGRSSSLEEAAVPTASSGPEPLDVTEMTLDEFHVLDDADVLGKCRNFQRWVVSMREHQLYQRLFRLTSTGALDSRMTVIDDIHRVEREFICFDSNSYLGLHLHPRVLDAVESVTRKVGYGTPSTPLLSGTNRHLRELELALAQFHGRDDAVVFPTGFAANLGTIRALIRAKDVVVRDQQAHASIHEGCKASGAGFIKVFAHDDPASLDQVLRRAERAGCRGKLVVTDGVFSLHGRLAQLPALVDVCRARGARLMVDDANGLGVLGPNGGGIEEAFNMPGSVDLLMGTLSKAIGSLGGYVCGSTALVDYLRWFAPSGVFTTTLPAPICAGARVALDILRSEPEHRIRLWHNIQLLGDGLRSAGFALPPAESPILTLPIGRQAVLWKVSRELFDAGIKCGNVIFPAVTSSAVTSPPGIARGSSQAVCLLRLTVNARHEPDDLDYAVDVLARIGRRHGLIECSHERAGIGA